MNILAIGAHPDDLELSCAGVLAKYAEEGHRIGMAVVTDGATGSSTIPAEELVAMREQEARNSAAVIGAQFYWLGFPDGKLEYNIDTRMEINRIIRIFNPQLIITHNADDYISDHRITSQHVVDAGLWAHVGPLIPDIDGTPEVPAIAYMEPLAGLNFLPERYIDVSNYFEIKKKMLLCHRSQQEWLKEYGNVDYEEIIQVIARFRGIQCGVRYAEGYRIWQGWQTTKPGSVMPE